MTQPLPASQGPEVLLVTGMSGAGRSTVGKVLEDIGYVVVDNLPLPLLDDVVRLHDVAEGATRLAATVDVRT
ncbi:MAG: RNase adaptor protein RapZ, partial [Acidimicrobiia bacterium]